MTGVALEPVDTDRECRCGCGRAASWAVSDATSHWMWGMWCRRTAEDIAMQARRQQLRERAT